MGAGWGRGLRLPSGELGYGRWAWDATLGPVCRGDRAGGLALQTPYSVLRGELLGEFFGSIIFFNALPV